MDMDLEMLKLFEQYKVESMHPVNEIDDSLQAALNRDIQGEKHSPSQQFATGNKGIGDANTNLHILENTKMKEQQPSKSSQQPHGVVPMNRGPSIRAQVSEFVGMVFDQVDENRKRQLLILHEKYKGNELTGDGFYKQMQNLVGEPTINLAWKLLKLRKETRKIEAPGCQSHSRESSTSAETTPKFNGPSSANGPSKVQGGPVSHFQNKSSLHLYSAPQKGSVTKEKTVSPLSSVVHVKQERLDQIVYQVKKPRCLVEQAVSNVPMKQNNGNPRRSDDELELQSSKMISSPSSTNRSFVSPSMTTQLDFSTMVNFPGPSGTIPAGSNVVTTTKIPSVGHKKPLEVLGSSMPPSRKKQKVCSSSSNQSIAQLNDVTASVNLDEEEQLLFSRPKRDCHVSEASRIIVREEEERTILQKVPLQRKLAEIAEKSGLKHVSNDVERCLSLCVEERMRGLLSNIIRVSRQRTDVEKSRHRTFITSDIRKQISEMNQKMKEELERNQAGDKELKNATENEDNCLKKVKANKEEKDRKEAKAKEEKDKMRAKAANVAAHAAMGGNDAFLKWKIMAEARQKQSPGPGKASKKPCAEAGGRRNGKKQGSPKVVRSISVKDVIDVVEKEPQMSKSTLLYRLYNRIGSGVQTQEKI